MSFSGITPRKYPKGAIVHAVIGILTGQRLAALTANRVVYRDGLRSQR